MAHARTFEDVQGCVQSHSHSPEVHFQKSRDLFWNELATGADAHQLEFQRDAPKAAAKFANERPLGEVSKTRLSQPAPRET